MKTRDVARKHSSSKLKELMKSITPLEKEQTRIKMQIAANIDDLIRENGLTKSQFAEKLGKNPSEVTKWLSGTQNFTIDVLTEIAFALGIEVTDLCKRRKPVLVYRKKGTFSSKSYTQAMPITTPVSNYYTFGSCFMATANTRKTLHIEYPQA